MKLCTAGTSDYLNNENLPITTFLTKLIIFIALLTMKFWHTVKPPIKDTPKKDKPPNKGQTKSTHSIYTPYKITFKRGQPLYKGQNAGSETCPLFRGSTVLYEQRCVWMCQGPPQNVAIATPLNTQTLRVAIGNSVCMQYTLQWVCLSLCRICKKQRVFLKFLCSVSVHPLLWTCFELEVLKLVSSLNKLESN